MASKAFCELVLKQLNQVAPVTARAMFGGYGLYINGLMFALIANDVVYFKVNDSNREDFLTAGMQPFIYHGKHKPIQMSYYQLPEAIWDGVATLSVWVEKAHTAARQEKVKQKPKKNAYK
ncbi:MAG: TfoX/Sxy family protein [Oscillatoriales cyanobacterium C42_A2020_001]|nr:TfoX/Sxy family protein [Leptolyngbyaceae cyanobacterium C42_A2020_001]